jgi:transglutaminase-like putative cysteine protease
VTAAGARARLGALALALAAGAAARGEEPPSILLAVLEVESAAGLALDAPLRATVELNAPGVPKAASLRDWFPRARVVDGKVTLDLPGRAPAAPSRPTSAQRGPSFLVDYDRPEAAAFREALRQQLGPSPGDDALARFVDAWIEHKSMSRGIDAAARVAARREGDCTEHAVLLAAAARLAGRAARVALGIALVPVDGRLRGFGHAWTEIHDGRGWRTVDATALPAGVRYLPLGTFADEGPGYLGAAWAVLSPLDVRRVVLEPAPAAR